MRPVDQWSADHLMPWKDHPRRPPTALERAVAPAAASARGDVPSLGGAAFLLAATAAPLPATLAFAAGCILVARRSTRAAAVWAAIYAAGALVELAGKALVSRPPVTQLVHGQPVVQAALTTSYPSGHTMRAVLLVGLAGCVVPCLHRIGVGWIAVLSVTLVACNLHTPTDVLGGLLAGPLLLAPARAATPATATRGPHRGPAAGELHRCPSTSLTVPRRVRHWMSRVASSQSAVIRRWRERADRGGQ
jgi:membrane-associated phospholipid phosphatase